MDSIDRSVRDVGERTDRVVRESTAEVAARLKDSLAVTVNKVEQLGEAVESNITVLGGRISDSIERTDTRLMGRLEQVQSGLQTDFRSRVEKLSAEHESYRAAANERYLKLRTMMYWAIVTGVVVIGLLVLHRLNP
jgi:hypothetical protein